MRISTHSADKNYVPDPESYEVICNGEMYTDWVSAEDGPDGYVVIRDSHNHPPFQVIKGHTVITLYRTKRTYVKRFPVGDPDYIPPLRQK